MINKNLTSGKGLSLSSAASISNLCYQQTVEIDNKLFGINNYSKTIKHNGEDYTQQKAFPLPADIKTILLRKSKLHATQGFLVDAIKAKDSLLKGLKSQIFVTKLTPPELPQLTKNTMIETEVDEQWGKEQLSVTELNELLEAEAYAAHLGQFIHKGSVLDKLRKELPSIPSLEWITIKDGEKTPVKITIHHTPEELNTIHNELALEHREYEKKVNYFKSKIKNLVTLENSRIAKDNSDKIAGINKSNEDLRNNYKNQLDTYNANILKEKQDFEAKRQEDIKNAAALKIKVDSRFQEIIDEFLTKEK